MRQRTRSDWRIERNYIKLHVTKCLSTPLKHPSSPAHNFFLFCFFYPTAFWYVRFNQLIKSSLALHFFPIEYPEMHQKAEVKMGCEHPLCQKHSSAQSSMKTISNVAEGYAHAVCFYSGLWFTFSIDLFNCPAKRQRSSELCGVTEHYWGC